MLFLACKCTDVRPHWPLHTHARTNPTAPALFAGAAEVFFISHACAVLDQTQHSVLHKELLLRQNLFVAQAAARNEYRRRKGPVSGQAEASRGPGHSQRTHLELHTAMSMYGLTHSELISELKRDTRCLMGWNKNTVVLAFRGTASVTNALSDLQVTPHS